MSKTKSPNRTLGKNIIGIFDSGLGGLTVFKYFLQDLPDYNYIYLGDNARLPYGSKSPEVIYEYTREAVDFLFRQGCNLVVIACNTASAQALPQIQQEYLPHHYPNRRVLGVIRPLVEAVSAQKNLHKVGILGTKATITSGAYKNELKKLSPSLQVYSQSAPLLVPLIEDGWLKKPETKMILKKYLHPLKTKQIDSLILACTHYPFLHAAIDKIMGQKIVVPHPGEIIARSLKKYLSKHVELELQKTTAPLIQYFTTDNPQAFKKLAEQFLGKPLKNLKQVNLSEF